LECRRPSSCNETLDRRVDQIDPRDPASSGVKDIDDAEGKRASDAENSEFAGHTISVRGDSKRCADDGGQSPSGPDEPIVRLWAVTASNVGRDTIGHRPVTRMYAA
jgi:hypothetical protein